jgi:hypothetical protein
MRARERERRPFGDQVAALENEPVASQRNHGRRGSVAEDEKGIAVEVAAGHLTDVRRLELGSDGVGAGSVRRIVAARASEGFESDGERLGIGRGAFRLAPLPGGEKRLHRRRRSESEDESSQQRHERSETHRIALLVAARPAQGFVFDGRHVAIVIRRAR